MISFFAARSRTGATPDSNGGNSVA